MDVSAQIDPIEPTLASSVDEWTARADVVVVGLGAAGASAALAAVEAGASVIVVERSGAGGGTSAHAGGFLYLGGGTALQKACGFDDTVEEMEAFLNLALGEQRDPVKIHEYCVDSSAHYDWLVDHGVPFVAEYHEQHDRESPTVAGLQYTAGEDAAPFASVVRPVPRGHIPAKKWAAGGLLMESLIASLSATSAQILTDTRVDSLVIDPTDGGRVVGVRATSAGASVHVAANKAVVLTAGGFIYNPEMVDTYCPPAARCAYFVGTDTDDGSGIRLGQGVGAQIARMDSIECSLPIMPPRSMATGVLVNGQGERFLNEDTYTGRIGLHSLIDHDGQAFWIIDETMEESNLVGMRVTFAADSAEALAEELGLPADRFAATIAHYNEMAAAGSDTDFDKAAEFLRPLTGALGAIDLRVENTWYAPFTLGGLVTDVDSQVLTPNGSPVPGLYGAGRTTVGLAGYGYASGVSLGDGTYFGRRAGTHAAGLPWQHNTP